MEARSRSHMVVIGDERGPETQSCAVLPSPCGAGAGPFPPLCGKGGDLALLRNCADIEPRRWVREDVMKQPGLLEENSLHVDARVSHGTRGCRRSLKLLLGEVCHSEKKVRLCWGHACAISSQVEHGTNATYCNGFSRCPQKQDPAPAPAAAQDKPQGDKERGMGCPTACTWDRAWIWPFGDTSFAVL